MGNKITTYQEKVLKILADKIENIRKQKGFTQKQLARKMKVSQQLVSRVESGSEISIELKIFKLLTNTK